jgi:hypothetical protein
MTSDTLVGTYEIAQLLGVQPMTIHQWRRRAYLSFPEPVLTLRIGPIWDEGEVVSWAKEHGRLDP